MKRVTVAVFIAALLLASATFGAAPFEPARDDQTALDRYIARADPAFGWKLVKTIPAQGYTAYVLEMTSQTWRTSEEVDRPIWKHWLTVCKPESVAFDKAFLYIGGGSNNDPAPSAASARVAAIATDTHTVAAELGMVPNQPLHFADSKDKGRSEDDLVAYSRVKQMQTGDDYWLVRLAMVKSAVRAMDAIQQFMTSDEAGRVKINQFVVAGGSKRGWTTWLTAIEDKRVMAIIPLVIDALNSEVITRHHYEAYGFFSPALQDYVHHKLFPDKIGTPEYQHILAIEDPYQYRHRERLKIPKYLINASGDQFFLPDNSQFYYPQMPEEKHLRYVPNAKHNLEGSDSRESLTAFYEAVLNNRARPRFSWVKKKDGTLVVTTKDKPQEVTLWQATNPKARDFRVDTIGKAYKSTALKESSPGVYSAAVDKPASGFTAFFVELVYPSGGKYPFKFTTEVSVVPDVLPFSFKTAAGR
ncbi:MAG TPA: PhoPQ-activated protein PqaA family protein [Blastocatellia bacterium]|nr:PhoPQ-activated protein PqaA family protein [Blastocatellia bacterium]